MRYAIVSDVHANLQAWRAVYDDIQAQGVDEIVSLGDIVGFGSEPARVLDSMIANVGVFVQGNHDAAVAGLIRMNHFNKSARHILEWTQERLHPSAISFLKDVPMVVGGENFLCAHGDFSEPEKFRYIHQSSDAIASWDAVSERILFVGHTHIPSIHMIGEMGMPHSLPPQELRLNHTMRYVINVGSVGQPRDGNLDACYCLYDQEKGTISFKRVPYDLESFIKGMHLHNLPIHPCMQEDHSASKMAEAHNMAFSPDIPDDAPSKSDRRGPASSGGRQVQTQTMKSAKSKRARSNPVDRAMKKRPGPRRGRKPSGMSAGAFIMIIAGILFFMIAIIGIVALAIN